MNILLFDFDGTIADSFSEAPNGMNVQIATREGVRNVLGNNGLSVYEAQGGLRNREPKEMVMDIVREARKLGLDVDHGRSITELSNMFVEAKMSCYQIDREWPKLFPGASDFFTAVSEGKIPIKVGIVSSGHHDFIERTFRANETPLPDVIMTSDETRNLEEPKRLLFKPHTYLFSMAHRKFLADGRDPVHESPGEFEYENSPRPALKSHIAYVGDDPVKDGGMAEIARIPFLHVPFTHPEYETNGRQTRVDSYYDLIQIMTDHNNDLLKGKTWSEILMGKPDSEVFPPRQESARPYAEWMRSGGKERF